MASAVWIDGVVHGKLDAALSPFDHAVLFGDGVKAGFRLRDGVPVRLAEHFRVLSDTAAAIGLTLPFDRAELMMAVIELVRVTGRDAGYVQVVVTRGAGMLGPDPRKCASRGVVMLDDLLPYPPELRGSGIQLITATSVNRRAGNLSDRGLLLADSVAVTAMRDALAGGCLDALVLDETGRPSGTTTGVLFVVRGEAWLTPSEAVSPDPVARATLLTLDLGLIPGELTAVEPGDELLFASSGFGVVGVTALDGVPFANTGWATRVAALFG